MRWHRAQSAGLLGRLLAILLLTLTIEFAVSAFLYERSSRALIRNDEAHRLAEHLVIARKLVSEQPWAERPAMASQLTTDRYDVHWAGATRMPAPRPAELGEMYTRILEWEPSLASSDLRVELTPAGLRAQLFGALRLRDGTWLRFRASEPGYYGEPGGRRVMLALLPAIALLIVGTLLFRYTLRSMRMLAQAAEQVGSSNELSLVESGPSEVRHVIRAFNAMQGRIRRLIAERTQALAAVGHDLRTPLARLQLRAEAIDDSAARHDFASDIAEMDAMVGSLLAFLGGESDPERPVRTDVAVMVATICDAAADRDEDVTYVGDDHLEASVRAGSLKRAVSNLVENALHYGHRARVGVFAGGETLVIRVDDDGEGIPEDRIALVIEPFTRLDPARGRNTQGLGLGLAIVTRVAEAEGGALHLTNRPEGGLRAELIIPLR